MHHPTDRIIHTTAFVTPVVEHWLEQKIYQLVHPTKDRSDDLSHHERTLLPRSYISLLSLTKTENSSNEGASDGLEISMPRYLKKKEKKKVYQNVYTQCNSRGVLADGKHE